jgi:hypothetical protein
MSFFEAVADGKGEAIMLHGQHAARLLQQMG